MNDIKREYTNEQIEERAKENSKMYWDAREQEELREIVYRPINRPHRSN